MFIVDFDYTLYQTNLFVDGLKKVFLQYGVDETSYQASYKEALQWEGEGYGFDYTFEKHITILQRMGFPLEVATVVPQLKQCLKKEYICDDAFSLLQFLKTQGPVTLLTAGNVTFQQWKVETIGLPTHVDECVYLHGNKEEYIATLSHEKLLVFINDNSTENARIKKSLPNVVIIGKHNVFKYEKQDIQGSGIPYFDTLTEIQRYIAEHYA